MENEVPVLLLTGFLGSGKTTLLNRILTNADGIRFAVIVNDIGEVNIDASLIQKGGIVGNDDSGDLVALQNGCICCTLRGDLMRQISDLLKSGLFDYIVIEASGVCEPEPIAQTICSMEQMIPADVADTIPRPRLDCIATVADALRLKHEFGCGDNLSKENIEEEDLENLIIQQIEFCNLVLLNKISEVTDDEARHIHAVIRALQPEAEIIDCDYCDVPLEDLLYTNLFNFGKVATSATWVKEIERDIEDDNNHKDEHHHHHEEEQHDHEDCHHHHHHHHHEGGETEEYGIGTFVYYRRQPFNFEKFDRFVNHWPKNIIRTKGVLYFSQNRDMSILFEQASVQKSVKEAGYWYATAPEDELRDIIANDPSILKDWDDVYGDRMIKLVFIGRDLDPEKLSEELDSCLENE